MMEHCNVLINTGILITVEIRKRQSNAMLKPAADHRYILINILIFGII